MSRSILLALTLAVAAYPADAGAQGLFNRIKQTAKERAAVAAARAAAAAVQKSGQVADTALGAGVTTVDSASGRVAGAAGSAVNKVQGLLPGVLGGRSAPAEQDPPSIPLHGAVFVGATDTLDTIAVTYLRQLSPRLRELGKSWTVIATVAPVADRTRDQTRADRRAAAVKAALVAGGMTSSDLAVIGRVAPLAPEAPVGGVTVVKQR